MGTREEIHHFRKQLEGIFELKTNIIGEESAGGVLNRIIRADRQGLEFESDQMHVLYQE